MGEPETTFEDKTLECEDCKGEFVWSAGEQEFFAEKGLVQPKRCRDCRQRRKQERQNRPCDGNRHDGQHLDGGQPSFDKSAWRGERRGRRGDDRRRGRRDD